MLFDEFSVLKSNARAVDIIEQGHTSDEYLGIEDLVIGTKVIATTALDMLT